MTHESKPKLNQTRDFLSKVNDLSRIESRATINTDREWILVLIDCDDIESLIQSKKIVIEDVENTINLLQATIYKLIENNNETKDNDEMFGYHLGGDLFALFINDNYDMTKSIKMVECLIKTMQDTDKSSFTISAGIGIRTLSNLDRESKKGMDCKELQREWILRCHINLLRAKENGKNCYFNHLQAVDTSKNNQELQALINTVNQLDNDCLIEKCERLCDDILFKFDENTIVNQAVTTQTAHSMYFELGNLIYSGKQHTGNKKYRGYAAHKQFKKLLKTFIIGKMSVECYYFYKSWDAYYIKAMDYKLFENKIKQSNDSTRSDAIEYDITLLTRKRTVDSIILPVIKNTAMYWIKNAWEHLGDLSHSSSIVTAFLYEVSLVGDAFDYFVKLAHEMIDLYPKMVPIRCYLAELYYEESLYAKAFTTYEKGIIDIPNNARLLSDMMFWCAASLDTTQREWCDDRKQRAVKALGYGKELMKLEAQGQYVQTNKYGLFASLLCNWSNEFENNKDEQKLALSIFEKAIEMDQNLGWHVINSWTRHYAKFESGLKNIVIQYWYLASVNNKILKHILMIIKKK